jgi:hypothetical protein
MKNDIHVVPQGSEWAVKREGSDRASSIHQTQQDAIQQGQETAKRERVELVIHRPDGRIRDSDSYGSDPNPPKDTKH